MIDPEDLEALQDEDGYIIELDGEQVPVGPGFDYDEPADVFDDLVERRGVEGAAEALEFDDAKDMVLYLAELVDSRDKDMDDFILESCNGRPAYEDWEAEAGDHEADELAGR